MADQVRLAQQVKSIVDLVCITKNADEKGTKNWTPARVRKAIEGFLQGKPGAETVKFSAKPLEVGHSGSVLTSGIAGNYEKGGVNVCALYAGKGIVIHIWPAPEGGNMRNGGGNTR